MRLRLWRRSGRADSFASASARRGCFAGRPGAETSLREIIDGLKRDKFDLVAIDSIQTLWSDAHEAGPGSVTQVRACVGELVRLAKRRNVAVLLVGHVTKDGQIAGPRVVEHMVDAVLSFEGERGYPFRVLRAAKNRFGATDEIGVFRDGRGLAGGSRNPSSLFLNEGAETVIGRGGVRRPLKDRGRCSSSSGFGRSIRLRKTTTSGLGWEAAGWPWSWRIGGALRPWICARDVT